MDIAEVSTVDSGSDKDDSEDCSANSCDGFLIGIFEDLIRVEHDSIDASELIRDREEDSQAESAFIRFRVAVIEREICVVFACGWGVEML